VWNPYSPENSTGFALQPVTVMFQDNVCHDLAVNKTAQPGRYYGVGHAGKVRSRASEYPADDDAPQVCQCRKADLYALCHRLPRSPRNSFFSSGILFQGPVDFHGDVLVSLAMQKKT